MNNLEISVSNDELSLQCGGVSSDVDLSDFSFDERDEFRRASGSVALIEKYRTPREEEVLRYYGRCSGAPKVYDRVEGIFFNRIRGFQDIMLGGVATMAIGGIAQNLYVTLAGIALIVTTQKSYDTVLRGRMRLEQSFVGK